MAGLPVRTAPTTAAGPPHMLDHTTPHMQMLYYRKDILATLGAQVPATW